jgi:hypothetical protein
MTDEAALPASFVIEWLETFLVEVPCTQSLGLSGFALRDPGTDPLGGFGLSSWPLGLELAAERPDRLCVDDPYSVSAQFVLRWCCSVTVSPALLAGVASYRLGSDPNRGRDF